MDEAQVAAVPGLSKGSVVWYSPPSAAPGDRATARVMATDTEREALLRSDAVPDPRLVQRGRLALHEAYDSVESYVRSAFSLGNGMWGGWGHLLPLSIPVCH